MQKAVLILFLMFLVLGIYVNAPLIIADRNGNESGSNSGNDSNSITDNSGSSDDDDENETNIEDEEDDENEENESSVRERTREIRREGNCTIKIERKISIEDGKSVETFKRKMVCDDGTRTEVKIRIENRTEDGRFRERIRYEIRGREIEVETEDGINLSEETNGTEYRLRARFRGNVTDIKIMPDQASEIALERLRALNFTVELRQSVHKNVPRVVYNIETNKHGRFLGVFKLSLKVEGEVDPETGEFIGISKPWWAFLVSGEDSDQTENEITINLTERNNSGESGTATLVEEGGQVIVTLNITGAPENVSQPAHIHVGSCPDVGAVKYPLTNVLNGESETTVNVTLSQLESELPLAINVHQSGENASVYVACGDIKFT